VLFDSEKIMQYMRNMVGAYVLNKAHMKIDNFGRVWHGRYVDNLHGISEPYYELVGTLAPNFQTGGLMLLRDPGIPDDAWNEVNCRVTEMLRIRAAV